MSERPVISAPAPAPAAVSAHEGEAFVKVQYPLTSFADTPHNVAVIGFLLGSLWALGLTLVFALFTSPHLLWSVPLSSASLPPASLSTALRSPVLGAYLACWATFHLMEFVVTSMWNPSKLSVSSFLLNNGKAYHYAHALGIVEHVLEEAYLPEQYRVLKHSGALVLFGFALVLAGQFIRSFAMITAAGNFSHIVAYKKLDTHELVTNGIYSWSRHPSYAGFVWWALGTQVMLGNPVGFLAFSVALYSFFSHRIAVEEILLIRFFGDAYIKYRQNVPTRILFI